MNRPPKSLLRNAGWAFCGWLLLFPAAVGAQNSSSAQKPARSKPVTTQEALLPPSITTALAEESYAAAAKLLEDFLFAQTGHHEAMFQLAFCYSNLNRSEEAIELYRELLERKPSFFEARINLGVLLIQEKKITEAAEEFRHATSLKPKNYQTRLYYAMALEQAGETDAAIEQYQRAGALDPKALEPRRAIVALVREQKDWRKFSPTLDALLAISPTDAELVEMRADILRRENKLAEILALYEKYFSAASDNLNTPPVQVARIRYLAGLLAQEMGQFEEALKHFVIAGQVGGKKYEWASSYGQARALAARQQYKEAIPLYQRTLELQGHDIENSIVAEFGFVLFQARRYQQAVPVLVQVLQHDPEHMESYYLLAYSLHYLGNYPGALEVIQKRAAVAEETPATLYLRAVSLDRLDRCADAMEYYEKFLARNTDKKSDEALMVPGRLRSLKKTCRKRRKGVE